MENKQRHFFVFSDNETNKYLEYIYRSLNSIFELQLEKNRLLMK